MSEEADWTDFMYKISRYIRKKEEYIRNILLLFGAGYAISSLTFAKDVLWYHPKSYMLEQEVNKAIFWNSVQSVVFFISVCCLVIGIAMIFMFKPVTRASR